MLLDMSDSIRFAIRNEVPSGIQRITFGMLSCPHLVQACVIDWENRRVHYPINRNIIQWDFIKSLTVIRSFHDYMDLINQYPRLFNSVDLRDLKNKNIIFAGGPWNFSNANSVIDQLISQNRVALYSHDIIPFSSETAQKYAVNFVDFFKKLNHGVRLVTSTNKNRSDLFITLGLSATVVPFPRDTNLFSGNWSWNKGMDALEDDSYYISVGAIDGRKRHDLVVDYFVKSRLVDDYKLFIIGPKKTEDTRFFGMLNAKNIYYLGVVDDLMYFRLLANARGVFYPSFEEGFGLVLTDCALMNKPCYVPRGVTYTQFHEQYVEVDYEAGFSYRDITEPAMCINSGVKYTENWNDFVKKISEVFL